MIDPEVMRRLDQQASLIRQLQGSLGGMRVLVGTVNSDGTQNTSGPNVDGWSSSRSATGVYSVTFSPAFTRIPATVLTPWAATEIRHTGMTASSATVTTFNSSSVAMDSAFDFIAIGPA